MNSWMIAHEAQQQAIADVHVLLTMEAEACEMAVGELTHSGGHSMTTELRGTLEIDHDRGVIYFHADPADDGRPVAPTVLRICSLPRPIPLVLGEPNQTDPRSLDVTHMVGCDWKGR